MKDYRVEEDALGAVHVQKDAYWGAGTQRSLQNFAIGKETIPYEILLALVLIKKAAAEVNYSLTLLPLKKNRAITRVCNMLLEKKLADQFPLSVWQTGSGTQTNMNVNEVIANCANTLLKMPLGTKSPIHPNDDVNMSQSSNDVFPSAMHIACALMCKEKLLPTLTAFHKALCAKQKAFQDIVKVGRTHLMDATTLTLGEEFSAYAAQVSQGIERIKAALEGICRLALGGTAVGTGLNAPKGFAKAICKTLSTLTKQKFLPATNSFEAIATSDAVVFLSGALKTVACSLYKIANDIRWMASGPRCGLAELILQANEPGSSIMPGKVNPTQCEALIMVCIQVMANDSAITFSGAQGNFELNVCRPLMAYSIIQSITLLDDAVQSFTKNCLKTIKANKKQLQAYVERSLMHATALTPHIGYDTAAQIVKKAHKENTTLKQAALELLSDKEFEAIVDKNFFS